jgi:SAM-dependent methyltransferase
LQHVDNANSSGVGVKEPPFAQLEPICDRFMIGENSRVAETLPSDQRQPDPIASTQAAYDAIAPRYAATWFDDTAMEPTLDDFLRRLPERGAVLDAGCGPGRDVRAMLSRGVEAVGIDISEGMLQEAKARVRGATFRRMNLTGLLYPPGGFAGVWACASLQHLPQPKAEHALSEFARVLLPGGVLFVTVELGDGEQTDDYGRYRRLYSPAEFHEMVTGAGFVVMQEKRSSRDKSTLPNPRPKTWLEIVAKKSVLRDTSCYDDSTCSCLLCPDNRFTLNREVGLLSSTSVIWGDDDLYLAPDLAPLTDGHLLLVATTHRSCFGACSRRVLDRLVEEQDNVRKLIRLAYGKETVFLEHGPAKPREAGSCIDHSHLHCIPGTIHVRDAVERLVGPGQPCTLHELQRMYTTGQSYLYVEDTDRIGHAYPLQVAPAQYLRQVVASLLGGVAWMWQSSSKMAVTRECFKRTVAELLPIADSLYWSR